MWRTTTVVLTIDMAAMPTLKFLYRAAVIGMAVSLLAGCASTATRPLSGSSGSLAPCGGPHCVSSQERDPDRHVEPLTYSGSKGAAQAALVKIIGEMERAEVLSTRPGYVHAAFQSAVFGFVDDVELVFAPDSRVDIRSSSRTGYYDFGVNRNRVEAIRSAFNRTQP